MNIKRLPHDSCVFVCSRVLSLAHVISFCLLFSHHMRHFRGVENGEIMSAFSFPHIQIGVRVKSSIMGGKTELTTIKTLMEITGQNKEDVQSVLQKFGGDEALAVSELMCSTCLHHLVFNFSFTGGKIIIREALFIILREQRLTLYDFSFLNYSA